MVISSDIWTRLLQPALADEDPHRTQHICVGQGLFSGLADWLKENLGSSVDILVCDPNTRPMAEALSVTLTAAGRVHRIMVLEVRHGDEELVCEDGIIKSLVALLKAGSRYNPIAVGAGTINDIVKMASFQTHRPYVCVPTAASMNGYTSAIAAILSQGVKRTLPCHQPVAIFADLDILCHAPSRMSQAGFGDLLSKPYSQTDWLLSHLIRGVAYDTAPSALLDEAFHALVAAASEVGNGSPEGIQILIETLLLSGFSMALAGSSAPASGGEHLVSHYWDMEQHCQEAHLYALHGTQVGIATRLSALAFEKLVALESLTGLAARVPDEQVFASAAMETAHPGLTSAVRQEVVEQYRQKQKLNDAFSEEMADVKTRWPEIRQQLKQSLLPAQVITSALQKAGCASKPSDIGVDRAHAIRTLRVCRQMRGRYVAWDLMADLGVLEDWADVLITAVEEEV